MECLMGFCTGCLSGFLSGMLSGLISVVVNNYGRPLLDKLVGRCKEKLLETFPNAAEKLNLLFPDIIGAPGTSNAPDAPSGSDIPGGSMFPNAAEQMEKAFPDIGGQFYQILSSHVDGFYHVFAVIEHL